MKTLLQKLFSRQKGKVIINSATYRLVRMNKKLGFKING